MTRILVVDDEKMVLDVVERTLSAAGYQVSRASDGHEALFAAESANFDVAIVDYNMPQQDGLQVLDQLRKVQPGCLRILVSGGLDLAVTKNAVNQGNVARVLDKPFTAPQLVQAVESALEMQLSMARFLRGTADPDGSARGQALDECFAPGVMQLALQPIVTSASSNVIAFEALLRSSHAELASPIQVLRAAEDFGRVEEVGENVVRLAAEWRERLPHPLLLFVNLHPAELAHPEGLKRRMLPLAGCAKRVVLEITERSRVLDFDLWRASVAMLRELGFSIAVDDLGSGYSSLSVLAELKPRYIKIDMSIVRGVDMNSHKRRLVEMLCRFAEATDATVIAEGVETWAEAEALQACGVPLLQGYYFGRPDKSPTLVSTSSAGESASDGLEPGAIVE